MANLNTLALEHVAPSQRWTEATAVTATDSLVLVKVTEDVCRGAGEL